MFIDLYKFRLKILLKDKALFFWTLIFPIMLGTFFWLAFSDITEKTEHMEKIDAALVYNGEYENKEQLDTFLQNISGKNGNIKLHEVSENEAESMLKDGDVCGIINVSDKISLEFKDNGMQQTILKTMMDSYIQNEKLIMNIIKNNPEKLDAVIKSVSEEHTYNVEKSAASGDMDVYIQYYFALIAMSCLFGSSYGMKNAKDIQIMQSDVAKRRNVAPTGRMVNVLADFLSAVTVQTILFALLFIYLDIFLGINMGNRYGYILLAGFLAGVTGVGYGYMLGLLVKCSENFKEGIMRASTLLMCFLAGLMVGNMKYFIETNAPVINKINPAAVISDSFYSLCVFGDVKMYVRCILTLVVMSVVFFGISVVCIRRDRA